MQPDIKVVTGLSDDRLTVTLEIHVRGEPLAHAIFEAPELEEFISGLAETRRQMAELVPADIDPGSRMVTLVDPAWQYPRSPHESGKVLSLRHPGLGWLTFLFPWKEAVALAQYLASDHPPQPAE